jgi:hypothetical protein
LALYNRQTSRGILSAIKTQSCFHFLRLKMLEALDEMLGDPEFFIKRQKRQEEERRLQEEEIKRIRKEEAAEEKLTCISCGVRYPERHRRYFMRRKVGDGFSRECKWCIREKDRKRRKK